MKNKWFIDTLEQDNLIVMYIYQGIADENENLKFLNDQTLLTDSLAFLFQGKDLILNVFSCKGYEFDKSVWPEGTSFFKKLFSRNSEGIKQESAKDGIDFWGYYKSDRFFYNLKGKSELIGKYLGELGGHGVYDGDFLFVSKKPVKSFEEFMRMTKEVQPFKKYLWEGFRISGKKWLKVRSLFSDFEYVGWAFDDVITLLAEKNNKEKIMEILKEVAQKHNLII